MIDSPYTEFAAKYAVSYSSKNLHLPLSSRRYSVFLDHTLPLESVTIVTLPSIHYNAYVFICIGIIKWLKAQASRVTAADLKVETAHTQLLGEGQSLAVNL